MPKENNFILSFQMEILWLKDTSASFDIGKTVIGIFLCRGCSRFYTVQRKINVSYSTDEKCLFKTILVFFEHNKFLIF